MSKTRAERIAEIEGELAAISQTPWDASQYAWSNGVAITAHREPGTVRHVVAAATDFRDAEFIAKAPERLAWAVAELRGLEAEIERLRAERERDSWYPEVLDMVRETLVAFHGEESMKGCPPMFYPEAIRNVAYKAAHGELPEEAYPPASNFCRLNECAAELRATRAALTSEHSE